MSNLFAFPFLGFVDDGDCSANHFDSPEMPTLQQLITAMQADAQIWHDSLWTSGGALELPKCGYHFIYHEFQMDGTPTMVPGTFGPRLTLNDSRGNPMEIKQLGVHAPHKTLGPLEGSGWSWQETIETIDQETRQTEFRIDCKPGGLQSSINFLSHNSRAVHLRLAAVTLLIGCP